MTAIPRICQLGDPFTDTASAHFLGLLHHYAMAANSKKRYKENSSSMNYYDFLPRYIQRS